MWLFDSYVIGHMCHPSDMLDNKSDISSFSPFSRCHWWSGAGVSTWVRRCRGSTWAAFVMARPSGNPRRCWGAKSTQCHTMRSFAADGHHVGRWPPPPNQMGSWISWILGLIAMENHCKQQTMISVDYQRLTMKGGESSMVFACFSPFSHTMFIQIQGDLTIVKEPFRFFFNT